MQSRLSRAQERKDKQKLVLTIGGSILLLILLVKFGIPFLINFSLFLSKSSVSSPTQAGKQKQFIAIPVLSIPYSATNSAQISFSGTAAPNETIKLYVNDNLVDTQPTKEDGSFSFSNVSLNSGDNTIQAKAGKNTSESDLSDPLSVAYKNSPPTLTVESPADGASLSHDQSPVTVSGKTDPDVKVTVNDFWAIVDSDGNYSYSLKLQNGDNPIKIIATDVAGNKTEKDIKVSYSQ